MAPRTTSGAPASGDGADPNTLWNSPLIPPFTSCRIVGSRGSVPSIKISLTCASELGSRGATMGLSWPNWMLRVFQSTSSEATRSRNKWLRELLAPPKKSMYTAPVTFPPPNTSGPWNFKPTTVWRTLAPALAEPGVRDATVGSCWAPMVTELIP